MSGPQAAANRRPRLPAGCATSADGSRLAPERRIDRGGAVLALTQSFVSTDPARRGFKRSAVVFATGRSACGTGAAPSAARLVPIASALVTAPDSSGDPPVRRPFAAKHSHKGWGWGLSIFGACGLLGAVGSLTSPAQPPPGVTPPSASSPAVTIVFCLALLALGVYLLRGRGVDPRLAERNAAAAQRQASVAAEGIEQATRALQMARGGGATVVAYRNLGETIKRLYPQEAAAKFSEVLTSIGFDSRRLSSPHYGSVAALNGGVVEVYRGWVILGQEAHDVDASTRGNVYIDGSVQVSSVAVPHGRKTKVVNQAHDTRTASLQLVSSAWAMSVPIHPEHVGEARRMIAQLAARVEELKPRAATAADISTMIDVILNNSGQPAAEKLKQLSNLRYERLLTDAEFEAAKTRILGI